MIRMAAQLVISFASRGGATSTISISRTGRFFRMNLTRLISSLDVRPPATGVPVPGAKAGSRTSISSVKYRWSYPLNFSSMIPAHFFQPSSSTSVAEMTVMSFSLWMISTSSGSAARIPRNSRSSGFMMSSRARFSVFA